MTISISPSGTVFTIPVPAGCLYQCRASSANSREWSGETRGNAVPLRAEERRRFAAGWQYSAQECTLDGSARMSILSDGVFEITAPDESTLEYEAFEEFLTRPVSERNGTG